MSESTELASIDDFLLKALKTAQDNAAHKRAYAHRSPKKFMIAARHIVEDGMEPYAFAKKNGICPWTYYDIRKSLMTNDDYEAIRAKAALDSATDYEMGKDLERKFTEKMMDAMERDELEIDAKGWAQIQRGQSMKADRFQKFSGAATQHVVVEHVVSQEEYEDKAAELRAKIAKAKAAKEAEVIEVD